jgi:hypothetical protein
MPEFPLIKNQSGQKWNGTEVVLVLVALRSSKLYFDPRVA